MQAQSTGVRNAQAPLSTESLSLSTELSTENSQSTDSAQPILLLLLLLLLLVPLLPLLLLLLLLLLKKLPAALGDDEANLLPANRHANIMRITVVF